MRVQIVCKRVTSSQISEQLMSTFGRINGLDIQQRRGHVVVELAEHLYHRELLECCRKMRFAYLRLSEVESGGSSGQQGRAVCVAGLNGQPLRPGATWKAPNGNHALFCDRDGLLVAMAARNGPESLLRITKYEFKRYSISKRHVAYGTWNTKPFERVLEDSPDWYEQWAPLMRAAVRKMNCLHCTHIHYRAIEDSEVADGEEESKEGSEVGRVSEA